MTPIWRRPKLWRSGYWAGLIAGISLGFQLRGLLDLDRKVRAQARAES